MIRRNKMDSAEETIKNLVESSSKIFVGLEPSADESAILAAIALKNILKDLDKEVFLRPKSQEKLSDKLREILPEENDPEIPQKIKIKIPKSADIGELRYEEDEKFLNLFILPKNNMEPSGLLIEKTPYEMDAAFCFFEEDGWEKINFVTKPLREKIIYFTNNGGTLAEKINDIHQTLNGPQAMSPLTATLLMSLLVHETENFQKRRGAEIFSLAASLLESGADEKISSETDLKGKKINSAQIVGRALARTTLEEELKTSWTYLTKNDFLKTNLESTKENIIFILRKVRSYITATSCSIICYEDGDGVKSLIFNENKNILAGLAASFGAALESSHFFAGGFKNFSDAETKIRQLLKENISDKMKE
ncbi:MAG: hypothetical protein HYW09_01360 [Candidatus Niyogibacteria bacterium]|nr:hypothetical protein [Candidatus Niyogibacteria bacterium]